MGTVRTTDSLVGIPLENHPLTTPSIPGYQPRDTFISANDKRTSLKPLSDKDWQKYTIKVDLSRTITTMLTGEVREGQLDPKYVHNLSRRILSFSMGRKFEELPIKLKKEIIADHMLEHVKRGNLAFDDLPASVVDTVIRRIRHSNFDFKGLLKPLFKSRRMILKMTNLGMLFRGQVDDTLKKDKALIIEATKRNLNSVATWYMKYEHDGTGSYKLMFSPDIEVFKDPSFQLELSKANFNIYLLLKYFNIPVHPTVEKRFFTFVNALKKLDIFHSLRLNTKVASEILANRSNNSPDKRPTALLIYNKYDHNGASEWTIHMFEDLINHGYKVVYHEVDTDDALRQVIISEGEKRTIPLMLVNGHGFPESIVLGEPDYPAILPNLPIMSKLFDIPLLGSFISAVFKIPSRIFPPRSYTSNVLRSLVEPVYKEHSKFLDITDGEKMKGLSKYFEKDSIIVLFSCSTGERGRANLKNFFAGHFPKSRILAPLRIVVSTSYFEFGQDHRVKDFVFIYN